MRLGAQLKVLVAEKPISRDKILALKPQFVAALSESPNSPTAYEQTSNYMLLIADYRSAITYAERSLKLHDEQWEPNRTLTIAHMQLGEYAPAVFAGRRAEELRNSLRSDPQFMYALAKSYAGAGNIHVAEMTLQLLRQETPNQHGTEEWHDAINFIAARVKSGNNKN